MSKRSVLTIMTHQQRIITSLCTVLNRALKHISSHCFHFLAHKLTAFSNLNLLYLQPPEVVWVISLYWLWFGCVYILDPCPPKLFFSSWKQQAFFWKCPAGSAWEPSGALSVFSTHPQYPYGISTKALYCKYLADFADILCYLQIQEG